MRICLAYGTYLENSGASGVATYAQAMASELVRLGHHVVVLRYVRNLNSKIEYNDGITIVPIRTTNIHWYVSKIPTCGSLVWAIRELERSLAIHRAVWRLHTQQPFDLIEGTETGSLFLSLHPPAPFVIRLHADDYTYMKYTPGERIGLREKLLRYLQRIALRNASFLTSPSSVHAEEIRKELGDQCPEIVTIPNPLTSHRFDSKLSHLPLRNMGTTSIVLMVGRLQRHKGVHILLHSVPEIVAHRQDIRFVIVGPNHPNCSQSEFDDLVQKLHIQEYIRFMGRVNDDELLALYQTASILVLPSFYEAFGLVVAEAMSFGIPVVASRAGGLSEVVVDGETGLLVTPGDSHELAQAIVYLLDDDSLRRRMGRAGRQRAEKAYGLKQIVTQTLEMYHRLVKEGDVQDY